jgi:hypothetical protein
MHEYLIDFTARGALRVKASSAAEARQMLDDLLDCANVNFGAWPNGDPALGELTSEGRHIAEIDGEPMENLNDVRAFEAREPRQTDVLAILKEAERALVAVYGEPAGTPLENKFGMETIASVRAAIAEAEGRTDA